MSKEVEDIKEQLRRFSSNFGPEAIVPAVVLAVNADDTIEVQFSDDSTIDDCRLKAVVNNGNKVLLIPAVDSVVLVGRIENSDEWVVIAVDEVTEMVVLVGGVRFKINASGFLLQKDNDTLKQILTLQNEAMMQVMVLYGNNPAYAKLQQALVKINNLLQ